MNGFWVVLLAAALVGCGDDEDEPAGTSATPGATDAADARSAVPSAHWEADEPTARPAFRR